MSQTPQHTPQIEVGLFEPDRFRSTVAHYVAYRLRYPQRLLQLTLDATGLKPGARVLDLGCGPGFLAIGFAQAGCNVMGLDPNAEMLDAARKAAVEASVNVRFQAGTSYDLDDRFGQFDLVCMGRSFHWMDRPDTLRRLDRLIAPGGAVVLFDDTHIDCAENAFNKAIAASRNEFVGEENKQLQHNQPAWRPHEQVLLDSSFASLRRIGVIERHPIDVEAIIGRALSQSATSPEKLGDRLEPFKSDLSNRLFALAPEGKFTELVELSALIAARAVQ